MGQSKSRYFTGVQWAKGHSGALGKELADAAADCGRDERNSSTWWRRPHIADWGEAEFRRLLSTETHIPGSGRVPMGPPMVSASETKGTSWRQRFLQKGLRIGLDGGVVPTLSQITSSIAEAGKEYEIKKCKPHRYEDVEDEPEYAMLRELLRRRRLARVPLHRHVLSLEICRVRRKLEKKLCDVKCLKIIQDKTYAMPRAQTTQASG